MVNVADRSFTGGSFVEGALETLTAIDPGDGFWDDVEPFVDQVRRLAAEKLAARELKRKEDELRRALDRVRSAGAEALTFHEASDLLTWSAESFDARAWPAVSAVCGELHDRLIRHSALQQAPAANRWEAKERRAELEAVEEEIAERLGTLRGLLVSRQTAAATAASGSVAEPLATEATTAAGDVDDHVPLDPHGEHYSVFTLGEEQRLVAPRPGVRLVFGSVATGLESVAGSIESIGRRGVLLREVPRAVAPSELVRWMYAHAPSGDVGRMIAWQRLGRWSTDLQTGLLQLLQAHEGSGARIILVGGPSEGRAFVSMGKSPDVVTASLDAVLPCSRWQLPAIAARLRDTGVDPGGEGAADVMSATRGWHRLLEVLWTRKSKHPEVASMIAAFNSTFHSPGGYSGFRAALGLSAFPEAETVVRVLAGRHYTPLPPDAMTRWIVAKDAAISEDLVARALGFLHMFQLLELDSHGHVAVDPVARKVMTAEF